MGVGVGAGDGSVKDRAYVVEIIWDVERPYGSEEMQRLMVAVTLDFNQALHIAERQWEQRDKATKESASDWLTTAEVTEWVIGDEGESPHETVHVFNMNGEQEWSEI